MTEFPFGCEAAAPCTYTPAAATAQEAMVPPYTTGADETFLAALLQLRRKQAAGSSFSQRHDLARAGAEWLLGLTLARARCSPRRASGQRLGRAQYGAESLAHAPTRGRHQVRSMSSILCPSGSSTKAITVAPCFMAPGSRVTLKPAAHHAGAHAMDVNRPDRHMPPSVPLHVVRLSPVAGKLDHRAGVLASIAPTKHSVNLPSGYSFSRRTRSYRGGSRPRRSASDAPRSATRIIVWRIRMVSRCYSWMHGMAARTRIRASFYGIMEEAPAPPGSRARPRG